ncbi:MAG: DUF1287 domain-containing protein [Candidatus Electrothrix sp. GW3-4]|uniref:DUF1287 domain-containing protein n=1 Tax=Candidatus Electrothrix sp. GW3-4 TaxID=3126740 RepID=UPI0030D54B6A
MKIISFSLALFFLICFSPAIIVQAGRNKVSEDISGGLIRAALERTTYLVRYDGSYRQLAYPGGDVPGDIGVCTDVVIRSYRKVGIDLQKEVHEDMRKNFFLYPKKWGLAGPDKNIDHRRVPNLQVFFRRHGKELPVTKDSQDYKAGELVTWMLPGNLPHIGIVIDRKTTDDQRPLIVHNIGRGPKLEDMLFQYPITGHYRFP